MGYNRKSFDDDDDKKYTCCFCFPRPKRRSTILALILLPLVILFWTAFGVVHVRQIKAMASCDDQKIENSEKAILELSLKGLSLPQGDESSRERIMKIIESAARL